MIPLPPALSLQATFRQGHRGLPAGWQRQHSSDAELLREQLPRSLLCRGRAGHRSRLRLLPASASRPPAGPTGAPPGGSCFGHEAGESNGPSAPGAGPNRVPHPRPCAPPAQALHPPSPPVPGTAPVAGEPVIGLLTINRHDLPGGPAQAARAQETPR